MKILVCDNIIFQVHTASTYIQSYRGDVVVLLRKLLTSSSLSSKTLINNKGIRSENPWEEGEGGGKERERENDDTVIFLHE